MHVTLTPAEVAKAVDVSESTVKRWCDQGRLRCEATPGGHRRVPVGAFVEMVRQGGFDLADASVLGLPAGTGRQESRIGAAVSCLTEALTGGDESACRRIIFGHFLSGERFSAISDRVIAPAFYQIGSLWEEGKLEIYQERRASEIVRRVLLEARRLLPNPSESAPVALGATLLCDRYILPTSMIEVVLRENGWTADLLGTSLPLNAIVSAIRRHSPKLFWISVSFLRDEGEFLDEYDRFYDAVGQDVAVVVGGRALTANVRSQIRYAAFCDTLAQLESFVHVVAGQADENWVFSNAS